MLPGRILRFGKNVLILALLLCLVLLPRPIVGALNLESARRFEAMGDHAQAASAYTSAAQRLSWRADLWQQAGLASLKADRPEDTISSLVRARQGDAITTDGWLALGDAYILTGESSAAITAWQNAENVAAAYERLVKAHRAAGNFSAGMQDLKNLIILEPENPKAHF